MATSVGTKLALATALKSKAAASEVSTVLDTVDTLSGISGVELAFLDGVVAGTGAASKAAVLDSGGAFTMPAAGLVRLSTGTAAAAGADAAAATVLTEQVTYVTAADDAKGVALPAAATTGGQMFVINTVQTKTLLVYPVSGGNDNINGLPEDLPIRIAPGRSAMFVPISATQWYCDNGACEGGLLTFATTPQTLTTEVHGNRILVISLATGIAFTLPAAVGSGKKLTFVVAVTMSGGSTTITRAGSDTIFGTAMYTSSGSDAVEGYEAAGSTVITLDGATQGGIKGDVIELWDVAAAVWVARITGSETGAEATPFS